LDQKLALLENGKPALFAISTSKFGLGDAAGSYKTPLGRLRIGDKLGDRLPAGAVIKRDVSTGEVVTANAPGRDAIVTRILWLEGLEEGNSNARERSHRRCARRWPQKLTFCSPSCADSARILCV
jgi:hypothetical protein